MTHSNSQLLAVFIVILFGAYWLQWFPIDVIYSLQHYSGNGLFGIFNSETGASNRVGIQWFTLVGAAIQFLLITWAIWKSEGYTKIALPVALGAAYVSAISITLWYEAVYQSIGIYLLHNLSWNAIDLGGSPLDTLIKLLLVFIVLPWANRENFKLVGLFAVVTAVGFLMWITGGYGSLGLFGEVFNGMSRIASDLMVVMAVIPRGLTSITKSIWDD